jgi:hypothetical protein
MLCEGRTALLSVFSRGLSRWPSRAKPHATVHSCLTESSPAIACTCWESAESTGPSEVLLAGPVAAPAEGIAPMVSAAAPASALSPPSPATAVSVPDATAVPSAQHTIDNS